MSENDLNPNGASPSSENPQGEKSSRAKSGLYGVLGVILALAAIWGLSRIKKNAPVPPSNNLQHKEVSSEEQQKLEKEVADLQAQIASLPPDAPPKDRYRAYVNLGAALAELKRYDEALAAFDKIRDENQNNASLWNRYALTYQAKGDIDKARESIKKAVDLQSDVPEYWLMYIDLSGSQGQSAVKDLYAQALQKTQNDINVVVAYARFLEQIGDKKGAIDQWHRAEEFDSGKKAEYDAEIARLQK